jgi:Winged helix domain
MTAKKKPGAMVTHRRPGIASIRSKEFQHVEDSALSSRNPAFTLPRRAPYRKANPTQGISGWSSARGVSTLVRGGQMTRLVVNARIIPEGPTFSIRGRDAWALVQLIEAGPKGCTPIDTPGPRWSGYLHKLRRRHGLTIETVHEPHKGAFPHARYVLKSGVQVLSRSDEPERAAA